MNCITLVETKFKELFHEQPLEVCSPGRVNLIGEHTDYNEGFVLPAAIEKAIYFAIAPRNDTNCDVFAVDMNDRIQFSLENLQKTEKGWPNYLLGVVDQFLAKRYRLRGFNCVFGGDIPIGAGLSSSAALEAGLAFALNRIFELNIDLLTLVKLSQKAENEFVGVQCGIMDQYVNLFGKQGQVLRIDCRSLEHQYYPFNHEVAIVLFDTRVSHALASSEYNRRRSECRLGVDVLKNRFPHVTSLRDVSLDMLMDSKKVMNEKVYMRCKYVVEENDRLLKACVALEKKDLKLFGQYMYRTHEGLSREYEVSCKELDFLVDVVREHPNVYGARMMGGGFGGCTINLIRPDAVQRLSTEVSKKYKAKFNVEPKIYITAIHGGTNIIRDNEKAKS